MELVKTSKDLIELENFMDYNKKIKKEDATFERLMFIYEMAIKELKTKIEIIQEEFKILHDYDLIDHINYRIKKPTSIINKMKKKECSLKYKDMIANINDIAGMRIICPLRTDIYSIRNIIQRIPGVQTIKEKDYITHPKESGYSAYHMILGVPVTLSQNTIYVKVEIQIRTMAMDLWATMEHRKKYKPKEAINKKQAKEWVNSAKMVKKLEYKMLSLS